MSAVDWQEVVWALRGSGEWRQLLTDLGATPGGVCVAALLQRAAVQLCAGSSVGSGGSDSARLAEAVQQVAWEKLHSGDWHTVAVVWRDTYAAACILAAAAGLPGGGRQPGEATGAAAGAAPGGGSGGRAQAADAAEAASAEASALGAALWHLDMAAIMGGPLLRGLVDGLIEALQRRWQQLHAPPVAAQASKEQQQVVNDEERRQGAAGAPAAGEQPAEPPAKRRRAAAAEGDASAFAAVSAAAAAAAAVDAAHLPPWSLGPRGTPVASAQLPSLEAFWRDRMSTETPVVVSGAQAGLLLRMGIVCFTRVDMRQLR